MRGHIRRRGKKSWQLKFDAGRDEATGGRDIQYVTFRGTRSEAEAEMTRLLAAIDKGEYVEPSKLTVADHVRARVTQWESSAAITARTAERYRELVEHQIAPHIGTLKVQKLKATHIEKWHSDLRTKGRKGGESGVSARTIGHAHRVLSKALDEAVRHGIVSTNVAKLEKTPRVDAEEIVILSEPQVAELFGKIRGRAMYVRAITAYGTGARAGEILAARWVNMDIDGAKVFKVREALEETKQHGIRTKKPKTKAGVRDISLPDIVVEALREHRRIMLEQRIALGLGKLPDDALVFPASDGGPQSPRGFSSKWGEVADDIGMPEIGFHALRHTHASQLIEAGIDIVTISKRLGHASPNVTLQIYAHLFRRRDDKAAAAINAAINATLGRTG